MTIHLPDTSWEQQVEIVSEVGGIEAEAADRERQAAGVRADLAGAFLRALGVAPPPPRPFFYRDGAEGRTLTFAVSAEALGDRLSYLHYHPEHAGLLEALGAAVGTVPLPEVVCEPVRRGTQPTYDADGDRLVLKTVDLRDGWIDYDGALRVSDDFFAANEAAHVRRGDVLVTATGFGSMGKAAVYDRDEPALITGELLRIRVSDAYDPHFLAHYLRGAAGAAQFDRWFSGSSGQIHVYEKDLERFMVPSAAGVPLSEQQRIAALVGAREREARRLEAAAAERREAARHRFEALVLGGEART